MNVLQSKIRHQICQVYGDKAMNDGMVRKWIQMFNEGRENVHDEAQSGRPSFVHDDLVRKINERVRDDRRSTIYDVSLHIPQITRTLLYNIVSSHLGNWKLCARRVPKMLRDEHKTACYICFGISDTLL
jgi:transposase